MRAIVTKGGFPTFINYRENKFIDEHFTKTDLLSRKNLSEREAYIAQNLVQRGVLDKVVEEGKAGYILNINNYGASNDR
jgi:hypothetical protein